MEGWEQGLDSYCIQYSNISSALVKNEGQCLIIFGLTFFGIFVKMETFVLRHEFMTWRTLNHFVVLEL